MKDMLFGTEIKFLPLQQEMRLGLDVNSTRPGNYSFPAQSVLDVAEGKGNTAIVELLRSHGAKTAKEMEKIRSNM